MLNSWALKCPYSSRLFADLRDVLRVHRIDQRANANNHVTRADLIFVERVRACAVYGRRVVVLTYGLQRYEPFAGLRQRDRHRPGIEVENAGRIQRVAIKADYGLAVDRCWFTAMIQSLAGEMSKEIGSALEGASRCDG